ncbi:transporter substrate-binding domain-containing protein [Paracraurococcus ruber]|nr:transporter substrate-binding domain-containing protein [Paracraurococcus ruber]TDG16175.1 transporter substrate-binding domain-containing protein [Paracraurococcus ruber]
MPLIGRRFLLSAVALPAMPALARGTPVQVMTSEFPPMTINDEARPGFVNHLLRDMLRMIGRDAQFVYQPWADTQRRAREESGRLITPLARTAAREPHYQWLVKVLDVDSTFGSLAGPLDLAAARQVRQVGVLRGALHQAHLQQNGFTNLAEFASLPELVAALLDRRIDAAFSNELDMRIYARQVNPGATLAFGPPVITLPIFIASGRDLGDLPVADLQAAFAALEQDGTMAKVYADYTGGLARR